MKNRLAMLVALAAMAPFSAAAQPGLQLQLSHCVAIQGVLQRLACYDGVAHRAGIEAQARTAPALNAPPPTAPTPPTFTSHAIPAPVPSFGAERLPQSEDSRRAVPARIESQLVGFQVDLRGKFTVTLANGQVWKQLDGDDVVARPRKSARSVIIERAVFSSYALTFNDSSQRYKVSRVQ